MVRGILEWWNIGIMGKRRKRISLFYQESFRTHYSNIPVIEFVKAGLFKLIG
jgi:hypothetical protein